MSSAYVSHASRRAPFDMNPLRETAAAGVRRVVRARIVLVARWHRIDSASLQLMPRICLGPPREKTSPQTSWCGFPCGVRHIVRAPTAIAALFAIYPLSSRICVGPFEKYCCPEPEPAPAAARVPSMVRDTPCCCSFGSGRVRPRLATRPIVSRREREYLGENRQALGCSTPWSAGRLDCRFRRLPPLIPPSAVACPLACCTPVFAFCCSLLGPVSAQTPGPCTQKHTRTPPPNLAVDNQQRGQYLVYITWLDCKMALLAEVPSVRRPGLLQSASAAGRQSRLSGTHLGRAGNGAGAGAAE